MNGRRMAALAALASVLLAPAVAGADWAGGGDGGGASTAATLPEGPTPSASADSGQVTVVWQAPGGGGGGGDGYLVRRHDATGVSASAAACGGEVVASLSCVDEPGPGRWTYTVRVVDGSWDGADGPGSEAVVVV